MIGIWVCMCCVSTTSLWSFSDASHCWKHCWVVGKCIQLQALRREVGVGVKPLPETMVALARLFGAKGQLQRGEEVLAAMEKLNHDPRVAWLVLVGNFSLSLLFFIILFIQTGLSYSCGRSFQHSLWRFCYIGTDSWVCHISIAGSRGTFQSWLQK